MNLRDITKAALEQGWTVDKTAGGHIRFTPPSKRQGGPFIFSGTPSDQRSIRNFLSQARRAGLVFPYNRKAARSQQRKEGK